MQWINCVDNLLSRSQALLDEGKESTSLLILIAEKGANVRASAEQRAA
jgi:hypothetical protein